MAVEQLPGRVREFARYLSGLLARLDQGAGWCGVFWQRDPEGMRAFLDGGEVPPWDVVEAVLQDLAAEYGDRAAAQEAERARALHTASLGAYDARPGARDALYDRLDVMLREQRYAADRLSDLGRSLPAATTREETDSLRLDLAWARDDHARATARCAELRARIDAWDRLPVGGHPQEALRVPPVVAAGSAFRADGPRAVPWEGRGEGEAAGTDGAGSGERTAAARADGERQAPDDDWPDLWRDASADRAARQDAAFAGGRVTGTDPAAGTSATGARPVPDSGRAPHPTPPGTPAARSVAASPDLARPSAARPPEAVLSSGPSAPSAPRPRFGRRVRTGARGGARFAGMTAPQETAEPGEGTAVPAAPESRPAPRGARFAGGSEGGGRPAPRREPLDDEARRTTVETVGQLVRLRAEGRTGEAHAVLVEAAYWPAARLPLLAAELHRAGLGADWATLLWEAVSLPADRLVAAADALVAAGRAADGQQMLRQGVVRPAPEIGEAVLDLVGGGRHHEVRALLDAYVRVRTPEEAVRSIEADPQQLTPLLLGAARDISEQRYWDLVHALRVAGHTA